MVDTKNVKLKLSAGNELMLKIAAFIGAVTVIAGGYTFYLNNIWKPKVKVLSIDFDNGNAVVLVRNKELRIYGDSIFEIGADWGIRMGKSKDKFDSIQLTKKGMVVESIKK